MRSTTFAQKLNHGWGKLRRFYYWTLRKDYIAGSHARRRGECVRCGVCCKLMYRCPWLDESSGTPVCVRHEKRPMNCQVYPIDEADIADRDVLLPERKCGYSFTPAEGAR